MILCISVLSVVISPFSFLILLIWFFSLFFSMSLANGMSILFILSKNQLLALLIFAVVSFVSFPFISALIFKISFLLLTLGSSFFPFLVALAVELGYLLDFFLVVWGMPVSLWTFPLGCFYSVPQILDCCVFIFICFHAYFDFFFDFFCDLLVIQQCVVQPPYVEIFNSFSPVTEI